jgi:hypothetical protein
MCGCQRRRLTSVRRETRTPQCTPKRAKSDEGVLQFVLFRNCVLIRSQGMITSAYQANKVWLGGVMGGDKAHGSRSILGFFPETCLLHKQTRWRRWQDPGGVFSIAIVPFQDFSVHSMMNAQPRTGLASPLVYYSARHKVFKSSSLFSLC